MTDRPDDDTTPESPDSSHSRPREGWEDAYEALAQGIAGWAGGQSAPRQSGGGGRGGARPLHPRSAPKPWKPGPLTWTIAILVALGAAIVVLSQTWTEVLWFRQVGFSDVIWTRWGTLLGLGAVGAILMMLAVQVGIVTAYRARPADRGRVPGASLREYRTMAENARTLVLWVLPALVGLLWGAPALAPDWDKVLLALHAQPFGTTDPQFGLDVSFYVFILPVVFLVLDFLGLLVFTSGLVNLGTHVLYGGVSVAVRPFVTRRARTHISVYLGVFSILQAVRYWAGRYSVLYSSNSKFDGANYTDVHSVLPAQAILAALALVVAIMFFASVRTRSWKLPVTGVVVSLVAALVIGVIYPMVVQKFIVDPNAQREEAPYIQRNIDATLAAYGLSDVQTTNYDAATDAQAGQLKEDAESTTSIRLLDPNLVSPSFRQLQQNKQYYSFAQQLNVDRYAIDGQSRDTVIAVRELSLDGIGDNQRNWVNDHTIYTHGYGVVSAYGNTVASGGYPSFWEGGIPSVGDLGEYEPRIYFGKESPVYSIVGGDDEGHPRELDYPDDSAPNGQVNTTFAGDGGPDVSNPWNRLLYATKFQEMNILFSQEVRDGSQILYYRNPVTRVARVAPWLTLDGSPYPAVVDDDDDPSTPKRVKWILDGYTTSNNYPYAQHESLQDAMADATNGSSLLGAPEESNYVRNSVKAVVDAYDGSVTLYQWDDSDPILKAWEQVFPEAITPMSDMSADLMAHMRYPEDLFKVQRTVLASYHVTSPDDFYSGGDFWKVPADPTKGNGAPQAPYYLTLKMPDQEQASFSLSSVYIIGGNTDRNVLTGFIAVDSETATGEPGVRNPNYGQIRLLELPRSSNVSGPGQVQNIFDSDPTASKTLNLLSQQGSQVIKGNLLTLPVGGGLLYVQPVYVQSSSGTQYPLLRKVLVSFGDKVGFADTLNEALDQVFGGDSGATTGDDVVNADAAAANDTSEVSDAEAPALAAPGDADDVTADTPPAPAAPVTGGSELDAALRDAQDALKASQDALSAGDWTAYGEAQAKLDDAIQRAVAAQNAGQ